MWCFAQNIVSEIEKKTMALRVYLSDCNFLKCGEIQKGPLAEDIKYHKESIILDFSMSLCLWVQRRKWYEKNDMKNMKIACHGVMIVMSEL